MSKGNTTRERIVDQALRTASRDGLNGLSIGSLATDLGLSKSGLFAHFGSKDELQVEVLRTAGERYRIQVMEDAFKSPRGQPRLERWFQNWMRWQQNPGMPGGCVFVTAAVELDDQSGPAHDFLVAGQKSLADALVTAAKQAVDEGHFRSNLDCNQFAFEMWGILLAYNHAARLLHSPAATALANTAFGRLIASSQSSRA
jgi:AcrR family transcriptional regulator